MKHRITKIKVKKGVYTFGWETWQESTQSYDAYTLICEDVPREELKLCLQALASFVVEICELHDEINPVIDKIGILKRNIAQLSYDNRELKKIIIALDEELRMLKEKEGPCMCRPSEGVEWSSGEPYQDDEVTETIK
jgi:hypothetical protein